MTQSLQVDLVSSVYSFTRETNITKSTFSLPCQWPIVRVHISKQTSPAMVHVKGSFKLTGADFQLKSKGPFLHLQLILPDGVEMAGVRKAVAFFHGFVDFSLTKSAREYSGLYAKRLEPLVTRDGFALLLMDWRGQGIFFPPKRLPTSP